MLRELALYAAVLLAGSLVINGIRLISEPTAWIFAGLWVVLMAALSFVEVGD